MPVLLYRAIGPLLHAGLADTAGDEGERLALALLALMGASPGQAQDAQPMTEAELEQKFLAYCTGEGPEAPARQAQAVQWLARVRALQPDSRMASLGW